MSESAELSKLDDSNNSLTTNKALLMIKSKKGTGTFFASLIEIAEEQSIGFLSVIFLDKVFKG
ncbi:hypothetical protein PCNPT3_04205 [Psychromonas sp. CNPT3]|uniref:hypothetical protein n=1 Tax=Psychromonas sp. CNPT3 TaxID=314282 RepID=UPI00006E80D4|nr:hypothetical protein [Psychromonas sp. CNPT3]AGH80783.1 hypothetical protein PCNPT3_04205 [Psychromonas sp. CNPT3]